MVADKLASFLGTYGGGQANPTPNLQVGCLVTSGIIRSHDYNNITFPKKVAMFTHQPQQHMIIKVTRRSLDKHHS